MTPGAPPFLTVRGPDVMVDALRHAISDQRTLHLESGTDIGALLADAAFDSETGAGEGTVVIHLGHDVSRVLSTARGDESLALVAVTPEPIEAWGRVVMVGLHGFSDRKAPDGSFPISLIDDWGIDDVIASAFDSVPGGDSPIALFFDLAVLDPVYEPQSSRAKAGGLDPRRLARAAYVSGRQSRVRRVGMVSSAPNGSMTNFIHVVLSLCAGLASR